MTDPYLKRRGKLIIVVLYQARISDSNTCLSLQNCKDVLFPDDKIFIWDNTYTPQLHAEIDAFSKKLNCVIEYNHTPENTSLAIIYNTIIASNPHFDLVCVFDQDSKFNTDYFLELHKAVESTPTINLFLPLISHSGIIVSPGHFHYFKGKYWTEPKYGIVKAKNNTAIMSGLAIKMQYMEKFGKFEERMSLYGIDTNFMIRYARDNKFFYVLNVKFDHDLSDFNEESREVKQKRFQDFKKASLINARLFSLPVQALTRVFLWYKGNQLK